MLSSPDYNDQTDEPSMSKNDTVTLDSGTVSMVNSYVGDVYSRNFSDNKQYSVPNRRLNESEKQQVAENKEKKARIKRDSESSSQVN